LARPLGEYAYHRPVANSYLVRDRDRRRLRDLVKLVAALLPLGLALLAYVWVHLQVLETGYHIQVLEQRLTEMTREERQLRLEAAYLASPRRIEERATSELGLAPPEIDQMIFWGEIE
jgi:cell division protein FtsL